MRIIEFHFNPKKKKSIIMDSFIYEPENTEEERLGNLYIIGKLFNPLPQHSDFLNNLSSIIKKEYFKISHQHSEQALKQGLKSSNEFLSKLNEKGDLSWLGNLDFAVLSLKDSIFNFTNIGNVKILIVREKEIIDLSQNLEFQNINPHPLKIFNNIISGKLVLNDKILILTKEIYEYFVTHNLLNNINKLSRIERKGIKAILRPHKKNLLKISGIYLLVCLESTYSAKKKFKIKPFQKKDKKIHFCPISLLFIYKKLISFFIRIILQFKKLFVLFIIKIFSYLKILLLNFFYKIAKKFSWLRFFKIRKNILLIITLILMLIIGHLVFG